MYLAESPEQAQKQRELDEQYERKGQNFNEQLNSLKNSLYGDFAKQEVKEENDISEFSNGELISEEAERLSERMDQLEEHPQYPLLKNMVDKGLVSPIELERVIDIFMNSEVTFQEALEAIENQEVYNNVTEVFEYCQNDEYKKKCNLQFQKDFSHEIGEEDSRTPREMELLEMIGEHYVVLADADGVKNSQLDLQYAFESAINAYISEKQVKKDEVYKKLMFDIKSLEKGFQDKFDAFKELVGRIDTDQGGKGGKQSLAFQKQKENGEKLAQGLRERFFEMKDLLKSSVKEANDSKFNEYMDELLDMREEAQDSGDIFIASDIDKLLSEINYEKEQHL